ncbi:MAG: LLM class F420-dependent oxidoreductase [Proteobacteria bacterium]|nr:LLM class F420-dependent oxidoreductase [Pseudomonadota bacterium]
MRIGAVYPQIDVGDDPGAAKAFAIAVEELGYDHILAFDHVIGGNPASNAREHFYTNEHAFLEPLMCFAYMAAVTERIEFISGILISPQRQTVLIAKQAATLDFLSGGRLRLGIGVGWNTIEYEALGADFTVRGKRCEEQIELLRRLWTEPLVTFEGKWDRVIDAGINPLPKQRPIPIWIGGHKDVAVRRAARLADGWLPLFPPDERGATKVASFKQYVADAGRDMADVGLESWINVGNYDDGFGALCLTEESWHQWTSGWKELGATHISVNTMKSGFTSIDQHIEKLAQFKSVMAGI